MITCDIGYKLAIYHFSRLTYVLPAPKSTLFTNFSNCKTVGTPRYSEGHNQGWANGAVPPHKIWVRPCDLRGIPHPPPYYPTQCWRPSASRHWIFLHGLFVGFSISPAFFFLARDNILYMLCALYAIARPSVCLSVHHTGESVKTVEVRNRIMQLSPQSSQISLVFAV